MKTPLELKDILQNTPDLILYAAPVLIGLAIFEFILSVRKNKKLYETKDFFASLFMGLVHLLQGILTKSFFFLLILWIYNSVPWSVPVNLGTSILCYLIVDFIRYWEHRWSHEINFLWAIHVPHHNSEYFNFSTAFRQSWTQYFKIAFFLPLSLVGFHPVVFFLCHQLASLYQFFIHTEMIGKLPRWFSYIFVTPSHHRVHHAKNYRYLDKNYGSTFIIWDRIFKSFQEEDEKPHYGILDQPRTFNPIILVFHVWIDIYKRMISAKSLKERINILMQSPADFKNSQ